MQKSTQLFSPIKLRDVTIPNRIVLSPLCMYSANSGVASDWQFSHLSTFARGGVGLVFAEATAIEASGRITPRCLGIWTDEQAEALKPITDFITSMGSVPGLQIAHAGRKAAASPPWDGGKPLPIGDTNWGDPAWEVVGPSSVPLADGWQIPRAMSEVDIVKTVKCFADGARRAVAAGFKVLEIHGAHGYLIHSFLSPLSNQRNDAYGGDLNGRMRFALEVAEAVRGSWPAELPLFFRISAVDNNGWTIEDSVVLSNALKHKGVDVIDCSAGGITGAPAFRAKDDGTPVKVSSDRPLGFQVPYAAKIRKDSDITTMAVGRIINAHQAEEILNNNSADLIGIGRELMYNPFWGLHAAEQLKGDDALEGWPDQYRWAITRRADLVKEE